MRYEQINKEKTNNPVEKWTKSPVQKRKQKQAHPVYNLGTQKLKRHIKYSQIWKKLKLIRMWSSGISHTLLMGV